jgi:hypothetical protein
MYKILRQLAGRAFEVRIRADGAVRVYTLALGSRSTPTETLDIAVCNELQSALEDALQGDSLGGFCWDEETEGACGSVTAMSRDGRRTG